MDELDQYGYPAHLCARDRGPLRLLPDQPAVYACAICGYRTDAPPTGTLADGFDVLHRQWGLRGDPHTWEAMRDRLAGVPTPDDADAVRSAYAAAFAEVTGIDLDTETQDAVHRPHLDHGGMSGGQVDLRWWRDKGLPLLVERARRHAEPV